MNNRQRILTLGFVGAVALTMIFAPWETTLVSDAGAVTTGEYRSALWDPPNAQTGKMQLRYEVLLVEWAGVVLIYFAAMMVLKTSN
jgi:hypothetical protein